MAFGNVGVAVCCDDERQSRAPVEGRPESLDGGVVKRAGGLVKKHDLRVAHERSGERELLDHPCRAAVDALCADFTQLELFDKRIDRGFGSVPVDAPNAGEEHKVRVPGETLVERSLLAERRTDQSPGRNRACRMTRDEHAARRGRERPGDAAQQRRLPGAVWSHEGKPLARLKRHVDRPNYLAVAETPRDSLDRQKARLHARRG
jgi:hypothetical protein